MASLEWFYWHLSFQFSVLALHFVKVFSKCTIHLLQAPLLCKWLRLDTMQKKQSTNHNPSSTHVWGLLKCPVATTNHIPSSCLKWAEMPTSIQPVTTPLELIFVRSFSTVNMLCQISLIWNTWGEMWSTFQKSKSTLSLRNVALFLLPCLQMSVEICLEWMDGWGLGVEVGGGGLWKFTQDDRMKDHFWWNTRPLLGLLSLKPFPSHYRVKEPLAKHLPSYLPSFWTTLIWFWSD